MTYQLIDIQLGQYPVKAACTALGVSRSAYYAFKQGLAHRPRTNEAGARLALKSSFMEHRRRAGSAAALQLQGARLRADGPPCHLGGFFPGAPAPDGQGGRGQG